MPLKRYDKFCRRKFSLMLVFIVANHSQIFTSENWRENTGATYWQKRFAIEIFRQLFAPDLA